MPRPNPFLNPDPDRIFLENDLVIGLWDAFPVSPDHALLITRRVVETWFDASPAEQQALTEAITETKNIIEANRTAEGKPLPDAYNIGINAGEAAGQTVFHLHVHVIPRYKGDVPDPRGGVRYVIPNKANYLRKEEAPGLVAETPKDRYGVRGRLLSGGPDNPLLGPLKRDLTKALNVDFAVAFLQESGVGAILMELEDLLVQREGRCRIITGDYLWITHPNALERLLNLAQKPELQNRLKVKVFQTAKANVAFHPKAYLFTRSGGQSTAYVGSSNLSRRALTESVEWNYRFEGVLDPRGLAEVKREFERLFGSPHAIDLTYEWLNNYRANRPVMKEEIPEILEEPTPPPARPHEVQDEALQALERTRRAGNQSGLVVLATGLGKTWLSAFDSENFERVLFLAHREEILRQSIQTFRRIRPRASFGLYHGGEKTADAQVLFASVQTLHRDEHLTRFEPKEFDYIVVDEFHHALATTYRKVIDYFEPQFLLGLTATPERTDGGNLLSLCDHNLVFRCDLAEAMDKELLSPLQYYGVPDVVDYSTIPWRSRRFDPDELSQALATQKRADNCWQQYQELKGEKTVAFCSSQAHADFMAEDFLKRGARAVAVHSGEKTAPRAESLEKLQAGQLDIIFCVDMFNEGVDLPTIDTVLMLRPTESRVIWLQQLGRGLRKAAGKTHLTVIDYIGNHRSFLLKLQTLWTAMGLGALAGDADFAKALDKLQNQEITLPVGCDVTYQLEAVNVLKSLLSKSKGVDTLRQYYREFYKLNERRPTALEVHNDGHLPRAAKKSYGSWLGFVKEMNGFTQLQRQAWALNKDFLDKLEVTQMSRSYKMVLLKAMLREGCFPGEISVARLTERFAKVAGRSARLKGDISSGVEDLGALERLLRGNPIKAWTEGKGTGGVPYFELDGDTFRSIGLQGDQQALAELVGEIVDWRLGDYLGKKRETELGSEGFRVKVNQNSSGTPILHALDRKKFPQIPIGEVPVIVDGQVYQFRFVKIAVNVATREGETKNVLPELLRSWFGDHAGRSGTRHFVEFLRDDDGGLRMVRG